MSKYCTFWTSYNQISLKLKFIRVEIKYLIGYKSFSVITLPLRGNLASIGIADFAFFVAIEAKVTI